MISTRTASACNSFTILCTVIVFLEPCLSMGQGIRSSVPIVGQERIFLQPPAEILVDQPKPTTAQNNVSPQPFTPPTGRISFTEDPSDLEIITSRCLEVRLVCQGNAAVPGENRALASAVLEYEKNPGDIVPLEDFLELFPATRWKASLLLNMGLACRDHARWSKVFPFWEEAWNLSKGDSSLPMRALADRALGEMANLHARLGHVSELKLLLGEARNRDLIGHGRLQILGAEQSLGIMLLYPAEGYRCGPLALSQVFRAKFPGKTVPTLIDGFKSTDRGTNLQQVQEWSKQLALGYQTAYRSAGAEVIVPSIVHWKVGHFAALLQGPNGNIISRDSTFGLSDVVTKEVLDEESSGYFLVPEGSLPIGWRAVSAEESENVFGKGEGPIPGPPDPQPDAVQVGGDAPDPCYDCNSPSLDGDEQNDDDFDGMTTYSFNSTSVSLLMHDRPIGYHPPIGPGMYFTATYDSQEPSDQSINSNIGPGWTSNWFSYLSISTFGGTATCYGPDGGQLQYFGFNAATESYAPQIISHDILTAVSSSSYVLTHQDGSKEIYNLATGGNPQIIFRTSKVDRFGNAITFTYDSTYRLMSVTDALQQKAILSYGSTNPSTQAYFQVVLVSDPFGRSASFSYNTSAQLASITDVVGNVSAFTYNAGGEINQLSTPYGTTTFGTYGDNVRQRGIQATDPLGGKERLEWDLSVDGSIADIISSTLGASYAPGFIVPQANTNLIYRNSFYWSKEAMMNAPGDYNSAFVFHWLHDTADGNMNTGYVLESTKSPLENRVWRIYPGEVAPFEEGNLNLPSEIGRILDDGTEQDFLYQYNTQGNITNATDPVGRVVGYGYAQNGIDVTTVTVGSGGSQGLVKSFTYNAQHEPLSSTDASGQTTSYTYGSSGQLLTVTDPTKQLTTFAYNSQGYLQSILRPMGALTSFTYDGLGRASTITDSDGYTLTFGYDAANRVTSITYPDQTTTQVIYKALDPLWTKDRGGYWTLTEYDALRHLSLIEDPSLKLTLFDYCTCGALLAIEDPNGNKTNFLRDLQGRLVKKLFADGTSLSYIYENTTSRLKSATDANGQTRNFKYYLDDRVSQLTYANTINPTASVYFQYDPLIPRISNMIDGVGTTVYTYNSIPTVQPQPAITGAGRLMTVTGPLTNSSASYSYDSNGRIAGISVDGAANTTSFAFDALGRLSTDTNPLGTFTIHYVNESTRISSLNYPNGQITNYSYYSAVTSDAYSDGDKRISTISNLSPSGSNLSTFVYNYNSRGDVIGWTKQLGPATAVKAAFTYDSSRRLISSIGVSAVTGANTGYFYSYDSAGNRLQEQVDSSIGTVSYNNTNEFVAQAAGGTMSFAGTVSEPANVTVGGNVASVDQFNNWIASAGVALGANLIPLSATDSGGNSTSKHINVTVTGPAARTLTYDSNGNLINNGLGQTYQWDAENRLVAIVQASGTSSFTYDGSGHRVQESLNGSVVKQWVWAGEAPAEEWNASGVLTKRFFEFGEQIGGSSYYFTKDHLGSIREMVDSNGVIQATYDYDPFGRQTKISGASSSDFGFASEYVHANSGLNLSFFRAYNPNVGRWLSRDPLGEAGGTNSYLYAHNNPVNSIDPSGLLDGGTSGGMRTTKLMGAVPVSLDDLPKLQLVSPTPFDDTFIGGFSAFNIINGNWERDAKESILYGIPKLYAVHKLKNVCPKLIASLEGLFTGVTIGATAYDAYTLGSKVAVNNFLNSAVQNSPPLLPGQPNLGENLTSDDLLLPTGN